MTMLEPLDRTSEPFRVKELLMRFAPAALALSLLVVSTLAAATAASTTSPTVAPGTVSLSVPAAAIALKQGFGRLIRSQRDVGVVALLDERDGREHRPGDDI